MQMSTATILRRRGPIGSEPYLMLGYSLVLMDRYVRTLESRLKSMESTINTLSQDGARKRRRISIPRDHPPTPIPADPFPSVPLSSSLPSYNLAAPAPVTSHSRADVSPMASLDVVGLSGAPRGRARIRGRLTGGETLVVKPEDLPDKEELDEALDYYFSFINPIFPIYHEPSMRTQVVSVYLAQVMASPQTLHDIYRKPVRGSPPRRA